MRIVNRDTFLALPANTLYSTFLPCIFGNLCIKGDTIAGVDWAYQSLHDAIECDNSEEFAEKCFRAAEHGESLTLDLDCMGRDGGFELDRLFAVWEPQDVQALIQRLQECA